MEIGFAELAVSAGSIILATLGGFMVIKVDLAKLKTDVCWIKRRLEFLEKGEG